MTEQRSYIGIIGGSGLYHMDEFELTQKVVIKTPYGPPSSPLSIGRLAGQDVVFLARHGEGHILNPSEINYRANIWALKSVGVKAIFSVSAVGSLKQEIMPGHTAIIDQFFDRTKDRPSTFFEDGIVAHLGFAKPLSTYLRSLLVEACQKEGVVFHGRGVYVCMEGPQFSTLAESEFYRTLRADVIGMTNLQEAKLAREAEMDYATLALSTDYDCWHPGHDAVTTEQVIQVMQANIRLAQKILSTAVENFDMKRKLESEDVLKSAIMTRRELIGRDVIDRLKPILGKKYF